MKKAELDHGLDQSMHTNLLEDGLENVPYKPNGWFLSILVFLFFLKIIKEKMYIHAQYTNLTFRRPHHLPLLP